LNSQISTRQRKRVTKAQFIDEIGGAKDRRNRRVAATVTAYTHSVPVGCDGITSCGVKNVAGPLVGHRSITAKINITLSIILNSLVSSNHGERVIEAQIINEIIATKDRRNRCIAATVAAHPNSISVGCDRVASCCVESVAVPLVSHRRVTAKINVAMSIILNSLVSSYHGQRGIKT